MKYGDVESRYTWLPGDSVLQVWLVTGWKRFMGVYKHKNIKIN